MQKALLSGEIPEMAFILAFPVLAFWIEKRFPKISACMVSILGGMILANLRIVPFESPMYDLVFGKAVPLAI
ncbi:MAG: hypothetical protein NUV93_00070, partial [Firmicutes bacterium]|nr:hypothetical protein [Bacillota bacterium]